MRLAPLALFALAFGCRYPNADEHFGLVVDDDDDGFAADVDCDDHDDAVGDSITFHTDADGDGVAVEEGATSEGCTAPDGFALALGDCDDDDDDRFPGHAEIPDDDIDQDCNDFDTVSCFADVDKDGWGSTTVLLAADGSCDTAGGEADDDDDCADNDASRFPGAVEIPGDTIDQNCDGSDTPPCYHDDDDDDFGDPLDAIVTADCAGAGGVTTGTDCDDTDGTVFPGASELCDGQANSCGGVLPALETDPDNDKYVGCTMDPGGWDGVTGILGGDDCAVADITVFPGAVEICDGKVNACGGSLPAVEVDGDNDTFVDCTFAIGVTAGNWANVESPAVTGGGDCNDAAATVFPGAAEICDGKVNACSGSLPVTEVDNDNDTFVECTFASGINAGNWGNVESPAVTAGGDCEDANAQTHPGAAELCDGVDNTCTLGITDEHDILTVEPDDGGAMFNIALAQGVQTNVLFNIDATAWFCSGTYLVNIEVSAANAAIIGRAGAAATHLSGRATPAGAATKRVIDVARQAGAAATIAIEGVTIEQGLSGGTGSGGAIRLQAATTATITDCVIEDNTAVRGAGIHMAGGSVTLTGTTIQGNTVTGQGGGINMIAGTLNIGGGSVITDNTAQTGGGVHQAAGTINITGASEVSDNTATLSGGGVYVVLGNLNITDSLVDNNTASGGSGEGGGGIGLVDGTVTLNNADLTNNKAPTNDGGGILVDEDGDPGVETPIVNLTNGSTVSGNTSADWGAGIACHGPCVVTATNAFITGNTSGEGAGILLDHASARFNCVGSSVNSGGVFGNTATDVTTGSTVGVGGGAQVNVDGATICSLHCDWGVPTGGSANNSPSDVGFDGGTKTNANGDATFGCTFAGCVTTPTSCP